MTNQTPPRLVFRHGKRVYLRPVLKEDIPQITIWMNDPNVTYFLSRVTPITPEEEMAWFESLRGKNKSDIIFAIVLYENDELIGTMGLHGINQINRTAATGSFIGEEKHRGKGYGTEAKMLVLDVAFNGLNLRKINSCVLDYNGRSKRCLEKCGYKLEGIFREEFYKNGRYCDSFMLAVFKDDFLVLWEEFKKSISE